MVKISDGYFFEKDSRCTCYTLIFKEIRKKFDFKSKKYTDEDIEAERTIGYYTSIEAVIKAVADDMISRKCDVTTIREYLDEYRAIVEKLCDAIKGVSEND